MLVCTAEVFRELLIMSLDDALQSPEIVQREDDERHTCTRSRDDDGNLGCHRPDSFLSRINIDNDGKNTGQRAQKRGTAVCQYRAYCGWSYSQEDTVDQPDIVAPPSVPKPDAAQSANAR
jgi:hypothetical protein